MKKSLGFLFIVLLLVSCMEKFEKPRWDLPLEVPLLNKQYPISDMEDNENFFIENDSFVYKTEDEIESTDLDESHLRVGNKSASEEIPQATAILAGRQIQVSQLEGEEYQIAVAYGDVNEWIMFFDYDTSQVTDFIMQELIYTFPQIKHKQTNIPLEVSITNFDIRHEENLENYYIGDPDASSTADILEYIEYDIEGITIGGQQNAEIIGFQLSFDSISFNEIKGTMSNKRVDLDDSEEMLDIAYPIGLSEALDLNSAELILNLDSFIGFETSFYAYITAYGESNTVTYPIGYDRTQVIINPATKEGETIVPSNNIIVFDDDLVADLMSVFPERIELHDAYFVIEENFDEDGTHLRFAETGRSIEGSYLGRVPFEFVLRSEPVRPDTLIEVEINQDNRDDIDSYAEKASIIFRLQNSMKAGGVANIYMSTANDTANVFDPNYVNENQIANLAFLNNSLKPVDIDDGLSVVELELDNENLKLFTSQEKIYVGLEFIFEDSQGIPVIIKPVDYVDVVGQLNVTINIDNL